MDKEFTINTDGLHQAVDLMAGDFCHSEIFALPKALPQSGMGPIAAMQALAPNILGGAARLGEATSFAHDMEEQVVAWLAPFFGMNGGHITPGFTVANLTALWSARECAGITEVVASEGAHLSIAKAAHILGLTYRSVPIDANGAMDAAHLPDNLLPTAASINKKA